MMTFDLKQRYKQTNRQTTLSLELLSQLKTISRVAFATDNSSLKNKNVMQKKRKRRKNGLAQVNTNNSHHKSRI